MSSVSPDLEPLLARGLRDPDEDVSQNALYAVLSVGHRGKRGRALVARMAGDKNAAVRRTAEWVLSIVRPEKGAEGK